MGLFSKPKIDVPYNQVIGAGDMMSSYAFGDDPNSGTRTLGVTDPTLQGRILGAEATYRPQYTEVELANLNTQLYGLKAGRVNPEIARLEAELAKYRQLHREANEGVNRTVRSARKKYEADREAANVKAWETLKKLEKLKVEQPTIETDTAGLFELNRAASEEAGITQRSEEALQREADIGALEKYSPRVVEAGRAADPYSTGLAEQATRDAQLRDASAAEGQLQKLGMDLSNANLQAASAAENQLQAMGMSLSDLSPTEQEALISKRGMEFAASTGELTPLEQRRAQQSARQASVARGRGMDQSALYGEMQSRMAEEMNKQEREIALGSQLLGQQAEMRGSRLGQGAGMLVDSEALAAQRRLEQLQRQQTGSEMLMASETLGTQRRQDYARDMGMAFDMNRGLSGNPLQSLFGQSPNSAAGGAGLMASASGLRTGPALFDYNAGVNYGMQNQANMMGLQGAQAQADAARSAGMSGMFGQIGSSILGSKAGMAGMAKLGGMAAGGVSAAGSAIAGGAAAAGTAAMAFI